MFRWKLLGSTMAAAVVILTAATIEIIRPATDTPATASLFDPSYISANICNPRTTQRSGLLGLPIRLSVAKASAKVTAAPAADQPLWDNLGNHGYKITTSKPRAQRYFDQGIRLNYAFNHAEAARAFRMAQKIDPTCAMCYWGEALVLGGNINAPMDPGAVAPAFAAIAKAKLLAKNAAPRERALIDALAKRYSPDPEAKGAKLAMDYAEALHDAAKAHPNDVEIATLYAEALMNTQPWDYWEADGKTPKGRTKEIISTLEYVLERNPDHVPAIHLYIHMVEASTTPERALPYAKRLAALMPGAGHIVHMPSHIYYRLGMWMESLQANKDAAKADEAYLAQVNAKGIYRDGYYPHNIHFVVTSAQMAGDWKTAIEYSEKLSRVISDDAMKAIPWVQPIKVAPYFAHAQFGDAKTILALRDPGNAFPFVKAMWHYARGVAYAKQGEAAKAAAEAEAIAALSKSADLKFLSGGGVPAPEIMAVARHIVKARTAQSAKDHETAIREFRAAAKITDTLAYMEPPFWYFPVRQSLGAALMMAGKTDEAMQMFRKSLVKFPNNGWALYGLMQSYKANGDTVGMNQTRKLFDNAWAGDAEWLSLARL